LITKKFKRQQITKKSEHKIKRDQQNWF